MTMSSEQSEQSNPGTRAPTAPATTEHPVAAGSASAPIVEMRNIRVSFGGVHAVEGVSVDVRPGEVVGLVGGNGAGKSTLMRVLSGAQRADAGEILVDGKPARSPIRAMPRRSGSSASTRRWPWPTTSMPPETCSSGASCGRGSARSTTRPWSPRRARCSAGSIPGSELQDGGAVAVRRPAPVDRDRPRDPFQRPGPDHGRANCGARTGRDGPGQ